MTPLQVYLSTLETEVLTSLNEEAAIGISNIYKSTPEEVFKAIETEIASRKDV